MAMGGRNGRVKALKVCCLQQTESLHIDYKDVDLFEKIRFRTR